MISRPFPHIQATRSGWCRQSIAQEMEILTDLAVEQQAAQERSVTG
jgi:hypothetical protein